MMSGTSLDGLDMAYCEFDTDGKKVDYALLKADTVPFDSDLRKKIIDCEGCNGEDIYRFSSFLGHYFGKQAREFIEKNNIEVDFIASHGQTVFHQPQRGFTVQIGDINAIACETHCTVIGDFRSLDVALGGQGAPLVPIGDRLLFKEYDSCLNLGGFSNVSYDVDNIRKAYDICPVNIVLNHLAQMLGADYDKDGRIAQEGHVCVDLFNDFGNIPYFKNKERKSLGKEFVKEYIFPLLDGYDISTQDKIATYTVFVSSLIAENIKGRTLVTGGGAYNKFLVEQVRKASVADIIVPDKILVDYKEALIFAFLGMKRYRKEINCLSSVTGAERDCCSGTVAEWVE